MLRHIIVLSSLFLLVGCLGSGNSGPSDVNQPAPVITVNVPPHEVVNQAETQADIAKSKADVLTAVESSANNTQSNMTGYINASISKLAEKLTGIEANLKDLISFNATMTNTANAEIRADMNNKLDATLKATVDLKAQIDANFQMTNEIKLKIADMNAQVGLVNEIKKIVETNTNTAGGDVNNWPKDLVKLLLGLVTVLCGLVTTTIVWTGKNTKALILADRDVERENTKAWQELCLRSIAALDPSKASTFAIMAQDLIAPKEKK